MRCASFWLVAARCLWASFVLSSGRCFGKAHSRLFGIMVCLLTLSLGTNRILAQHRWPPKAPNKTIGWWWVLHNLLGQVM